MVKAVRFQMEQVEAARKLLQALPPKNAGKTKQELATLLAKDIQASLQKGYTLKELSEVLKADGIPLSVSLLKTNATVARNKKGKNTPPVATDNGQNIDGTGV